MANSTTFNSLKVMCLSASSVHHKPDTKCCWVTVDACAPYPTSLASVNKDSLASTESHAEKHSDCSKLAQKCFKRLYATLERRTTAESYQEVV